MTPEKIQLYEMHDIIAALPREEQIMVETIARNLRAMIQSNAHALMALSLVGAEEAAKP